MELRSYKETPNLYEEIKKVQKQVGKLAKILVELKPDLIDTFSDYSIDNELCIWCGGKVETVTAYTTNGEHSEARCNRCGFLFVED